MTSFFIAIGFAIGAIAVLNILKLKNIVDYCLFFFVVYVGFILCSGYFLSATNYLGSSIAWTILALLFCALGSIYLSVSSGSELNKWGKICIDLKSYWLKWNVEFTQLSVLNRLTLQLLLLTFVFLAIVNLYIALYMSPGNWDSMTYHLARMAYYLQQGNLNAYGANYWAQEVHPKNATLILIFSFISSNRNENATQLVQYFSYLICCISVYGVASKITSSRTSSLFSACIFGLLTESLMEATTTQNDLVLAAFIGCALYGLIAWINSNKNVYLMLAIISACIALGIKSSSLLILPCLLITLVGLIISTPKFKFLPSSSNQEIKEKRNRYPLPSALNHIGLVTFFSLILGIALFVLPAGYLSNWRDFGHPIGPESVRVSHAFEGQSPEFILNNGFRNMGRYAVEFVSLDGLTGPYAEKVQQKLRLVVKSSIEFLNVDLEQEKAIRQPFDFHKSPQNHEDKSYWGLIGFILIWPAVIFSIFFPSSPRSIRLLGIVTLIYLLIQSFAGPYDPWRGRYFISGAIFAVPITGYFFGKSGKFSILFSWLLLTTSVLGSLSAINAVLDRRNNIPWEVRRLDRLGQILRNTGQIEQQYKFDKYVPKEATVALALVGDSYEYPLFGQKISRTIIPINGFRSGLLQIPNNVDFLLYDTNVISIIEPKDVHLGGNWYLRKLIN